VAAGLASRFPPIRGRHMDIRRSGFQHRSLNSARAASPGPASGLRRRRLRVPFPAGMMHGDGYRGDRREGTGVVLVGLDPVSTGTGKPT